MIVPLSPTGQQASFQQLAYRWSLLRHQFRPGLGWMQLQDLFRWGTEVHRSCRLRRRSRAWAAHLEMDGVIPGLPVVHSLCLLLHQCRTEGALGDTEGVALWITSLHKLYPLRHLFRPWQEAAMAAEDGSARWRALARKVHCPPHRPMGPLE